MSSLRRWPDRLSEIIVSLQKLLSDFGPDRTRNRKSTAFYTVRKHILGYATDLITALGADPQGHEKISNQIERDIERGAPPHAQSGDHAPWPDTKESTASYFGQAIFKYHRCIEILEALVWLGHPDPLSVVIHDSCDCCGEPVSLYEAFEEKRYELVRAGPYLEIDADDLDSFLSYHESVLRYANGDRSPDLLLRLGLLKRKVYITGRYWFKYCTATFCPLCRAEYERRRSWVRAITPKELVGLSGDGLGSQAELPDGVTLDQAAAASGGKAPPPIDFDALVNALLEQEKPTQAALVRFMADRQTATAEEIGDKVHGNPEASDKAIGKNARETTVSLAGIGSRLSFRFASSTMFRKIADE